MDADLGVHHVDDGDRDAVVLRSRQLDADLELFSDNCFKHRRRRVQGHYILVPHIVTGLLWSAGRFCLVSYALCFYSRRRQSRE